MPLWLDLLRAIKALGERLAREGAAMSRPREPRIVDLDTHPRAFVGLQVAAEFLCVHRQTLDEMIDEGRIIATPFLKQRKIAVAELRRFVAIPNQQAS